MGCLMYLQFHQTMQMLLLLQVITNVNNVGNNITNIVQLHHLSDVVWKISTSAPTTSLDNGDLFHPVNTAKI